MIPTYSNDKGVVLVAPTFEQAVAAADAQLATVGETPTSIAIRDGDKKLVAVVTNRTEIAGIFVKQVYGGGKGDYAAFNGEDTFNGFEPVLRLPLETLRDFDDGTEAADEVGREVVDWSGPCEVVIAESIKEFFAVEALSDLTQEALDFVLARVQLKDAEYEVVEVRVALTIRLKDGVSVDSVLENMNYSFEANTPGARIVDTEIR